MSIDLQIEKGTVEEETIYTVSSKWRFTSKELQDPRPIQVTKKQLFELMAGAKDEGQTEDNSVEKF